MSEMIERVALALAREQQSVTMATVMPSHKIVARSIIEAMLEPTEDMVSAGEGFNFAIVTWQVMICEALK